MAPTSNQWISLAWSWFFITISVLFAKRDTDLWSGQIAAHELITLLLWFHYFIKSMKNQYIIIIIYKWLRNILFINEYKIQYGTIKAITSVC